MGLLAILPAESDRFRMDACSQIARLAPVKARAPLVDLLESEDPAIRLRAIRALGELKSAATRKPLKELMEETDSVIVETTQQALSKIGLAAWARHGAVIALGNIGSPNAVKTLKQLVQLFRLELFTQH